MYTIKDFRVGDRVEFHPATALWMLNARFGDVEFVGRKFLTVRVDRIGFALRLRPEDIGKIIYEGQVLDGG